jgi:hypothetical protein
MPRRTVVLEDVRSHPPEDLDVVIVQVEIVEMEVEGFHSVVVVTMVVVRVVVDPQHRGITTTSLDAKRKTWWFVS